MTLSGRLGLRAHTCLSRLRAGVAVMGVANPNLGVVILSQNPSKTSQNPLPKPSQNLLKTLRPQTPKGGGFSCRGVLLIGGWGYSGDDHKMRI